ncbi:SUKH-4 family immunity protein [Streptomyces sp. NPDC006514]|uniref:SUKH-4 family immunity protein n=1 Tax=Streptomyces sp. NPDC006514 TaxID=3154308 RepID=UPI0033BB2DEC
MGSRARPTEEDRSTATYDQLTEWAGPGRVTRAGRDVVAGWRLPGGMKAQLVEVGVPVAPRLMERVVVQSEADPVLLTSSRGPLYRLTERADPGDQAERSSFLGVVDVLQALRTPISMAKYVGLPEIR